MSLIDSANKYKCTKESYHGYMEYYEKVLYPLRYMPINLLEIGVRTGESMRMWKDYFPHANIFGIDIIDCTNEQEDRIKIFTGNQRDINFLDKVLKEIGKIDIFIDDGSHHCVDIIMSLDFFYRHIPRGGYYIIEDIDPHQGKDCVKKYLEFLTDYDKELTVEYFPSKASFGEDLGIINRK